jgi:precorrin-6x reductase
LVTVGTRQLTPYVLAATHTQVKLYARVLDNAESRDVIASLGIPSSCVLWGRGPFGLEQNLQHLRYCEADVLVTKDSGAEGGTREKLEAARQLGCCSIVVARPKEAAEAVESVEALLERLRQIGL